MVLTDGGGCGGGGCGGGGDEENVGGLLIDMAEDKGDVNHRMTSEAGGSGAIELVTFPTLGTTPNLS